MIEEILITEIAEELVRAEKQHPDWPSDVVHQAAIVAEEAGELVQAALQMHYESGASDALWRETIQTAAMCFRVLIGLMKRGE